MPAVVTIDQRSSRTSPDRVPEWVSQLNREFSSELRLPFVRTVGDELQALVSSPRAIIEIVLRGVRFEDWWVGIGLGDVETPLGETSATSRGDAFYRARDAVAIAKESPYGFAVLGDDDDRIRAISASFTLLCFLTRRRGVTARNSKRWEAADLAREGLAPKDIGLRLGISRQAVSQRLRAAGWEEEREGRWLANWLLTAAIGSDG